MLLAAMCDQEVVDPVQQDEVCAATRKAVRQKGTGFSTSGSET